VLIDTVTVGTDRLIYTRCWFSQVVWSELILSSWFNETMLKIMCPPGPNPQRSVKRLCSRPSTAGSSALSQPQPSGPGLTRQCSTTSSHILHACQVRLTTISSGFASRSPFLQMHPPPVRIGPTSSNCASHSPGHVSSECPSFRKVNHPSPSSPPCPDCCPSPLSALLASGGDKKKLISLPWPHVWSTLCVPVFARCQQA